MTRVTRARIGYVLALLGIGLPAVGLVVYTGEPFYGVILGALFIVPGRVQGWMWRDLFRGARMLREGKLRESVVCTERFLAALRARPWLRHGVWLAGWIYTPDAEAMALNNLGAAQLELGRLDEAEASLERAAERDPAYPLPWFNLAALTQARGDAARARAAWQQSVALGYTGTTLDMVTHRAQAILARVEGR